MECIGQLRFGTAGEAAASTLALVLPCVELVRDGRGGRHGRRVGRHGVRRLNPRRTRRRFATCSTSSPSPRRAAPAPANADPDAQGEAPPAVAAGVDPALARRGPATRTCALTHRRSDRACAVVGARARSAPRRRRASRRRARRRPARRRAGRSPGGPGCAPPRPPRSRSAPPPPSPTSCSRARGRRRPSPAATAHRSRAADPVRRTSRTCGSSPADHRGLPGPPLRRGRRSRCPAARARTSVAPETRSGFPSQRRPGAQRRAPHPARRRLDHGTRDRPPVPHGRERDRVPGQAVEEVDGAVDRVDHPAALPGAGRAARRAPRPRRVAGPQRREPLAHERLDGVVGRGDDVGRRALGGHAVPTVHRSPTAAAGRAGARRPRRATCSAIRRSSRGSSVRIPLVSACPVADRSLTTPSDHMRAAAARGRTRGTPKGVRPWHAQLQWLRYPHTGRPPTRPVPDALRRVDQDLDRQPVSSATCVPVRVSAP